MRQMRERGLQFLLPVFWELWDSKFWREKGYDGKSFRQDKCHPSIEIFFHDGMWRTGAGGYESDLILYKVSNLLWGRSLSNDFDFFMVRIGWAVYYKRKHKKANNIRPLTINERELFKKLRDEF